MRQGILGGTLDPVHNGHLAIALAVRRELALDDVMLLPAGTPPHKHNHTARSDRWAMACLAAQSAGLSISDAEILRDGTTYTVDTLLAFTAANPDTQYVYILGGDTLSVLDSWRRFPEIARLTEFAAVRRPGCDGSGDEARARFLRDRYGAVIHLLQAEGPDISSTGLREMAALGHSLRGYVPDSVARYIDENGLYLTTAPLDEVRARLRDMLTPHRYAHTLGVAQTARRLAEIHGLHPARAYLAGLLHDCAKSMDEMTLRETVAGFPWDVDPLEMDMPQVLHAPASAVVAYKEFGVRDAEILSAIRRHTLGGAGMSPFEALIYVSDFVEPGRAEFEGLAEARRLAETDLRAAVKLCAKRSLAYLAARHEAAHPKTIELLNERI